MDATLELQVLDVKPGSVVVVRGASDADLHHLIKVLRDKGLSDVLLVNLKDGQDLTVLDEDMMREYGWVRRGGYAGAQQE